eukprot:4787235-Amphidinium_carterae.1
MVCMCVCVCRCRSRWAAAKAATDEGAVEPAKLGYSNANQLPQEYPRKSEACCGADPGKIPGRNQQVQIIHPGIICEEATIRQRETKNWSALLGRGTAFGQGEVCLPSALSTSSTAPSLSCSRVSIRESASSSEFPEWDTLW